MAKMDTQRSTGSPPPPLAPRPPPSAVRLVTTLVIAGLASGTALAGVYVGTAPRIAENRAAALARAVLAVVPGATRFEARSPAPGVSGEAASSDAPDNAPRAYVGFDQSGQPLGYALEAEGPGFMDTIRLLYGLDPGGRHVIGLQILDSRETPGLGDKIMTDPEFVHSFDHLQVDPEIVPVTGGPRTRDNEVDCISGATISSKAVVRIIQTSLSHWLPVLAQQGQKGQEGKKGDAR